MATVDVDLELYDRVWKEAFEKGELDVIDEVISEDYVLHTPSDPEPIRGSEAFKELVREWHEAFPDLSVTIEERHVAEDAVVERYRFRGTHEGAFQGIPPTGEQIDVTGLILHTLEDGVAVEDYSEYDTFTLLQQLGVTEPPGP